MSPSVNSRLAPSFLVELFLLIRILLLHVCNYVVRENSDEPRGGLTILFFLRQTRIFCVSDESRMRYLIVSTAAAQPRAYEGPQFQFQASSDYLRGLCGPRRDGSG